MRRTLTFAVLVGCSGEPVRGGTPAQHALVQLVLEETEQAVGTDLAVASVRFRNVRGGEGKYNSVTHQISLDADLTDDRLVTDLRHELCHALDFQFGFRPFEHDAWRIDDEAQRYGSANRQAREAFATVCGVTPAATALIQPCGTSGLDDELDRMQREIFAATATVPLLEPAWTGFVHLDEGERLWDVQRTDTGNVWIWSDTGLQTTDRKGDAVQGDPGDQVEPRPLATEAVGPWVLRDGTEDGIEVALARRLLIDGSRLDQLVVIGEHGVEATACAEPEDRWFVLDEEVWLVRRVGTEVRWGPLRS